MRKAIFLLLSTLASITADAQMQYAEHSLLAQGKWVKIRVDNSGVYQLSKNDLKKMGFSDPAKVKLYGYNLPVLPDDDIDGMDDDLTEIPLYRDTPSGNLLFYSKGTTLWTKSGKKFYHLNNPYSSHIYYFLTEDTSGAPATFNTYDAGSNATITQKTTYAHSIYDKDEYSFGNFGRRFYESTEYSSGTAKAYSINVNKHTTSNIYVDVLFGSKSSNSTTVSITANKNKTTTLSYRPLEDNAVAMQSSSSFAVSELSTNTLPITLKMTSGDKGHLDYIRASYERELDMTGENYIEFSPNEKGTAVFEISGANENTIVWDITSISSMCALKGTYSNGTYKVISEDMLVSDTYVVLDKNATYPAPTRIGTVENQDLHSMTSVDLLVIVPTSGKLTAQAERLAAFHKTHDNIDYAIVSADKIYNEFSSGTPDVTAYRRFIKMLYEKGESGKGRKLKNVLLFGASVWDNKLMLLDTKKYSTDDYLLCYESDNSESTISSYVLEEYIVCPYDNVKYGIYSNKPLIGLGRIPVTTADEAKGVVDKTISYILNTDAGNWRNSICIMADDGTTKEGAYAHMKYADAMANTLESSYTNFRFSHIYWDAYPWEQSATGTRYPGVENDINKTVLDGALIMNYTGHGAPLTLSHEMAVKIDDFKNWKTTRPPVWITAACETTPFDMNTDNLGEAAVLNKNGGAIAFFGTTRAVYGNENDRINRLLMKYLLCKENGKRYSLGEALSKAKADITNSNSGSSCLLNKSQYILLGDPAIVLPNPDYNIVIDSINGKDVNEEITISAGEKVTVSGHIVNEKGDKAEDFNGIVEPSVYDSRESITSKNNNGSGNDIFTFSDYSRKLYDAADSIKNGVFTFSFPVPLDNNYSYKNGLINLYAINKDNTIEAFGSFRDFIIGGTNITNTTDTIGPTIATFINSDNTIDGQKVNETPTIYVHLTDSSGINASGNGLGHDIVAIIDGKEATTYNLNNYFRQTTGDYTSGKIEYTFPTLEAGSHILTIRAFDTLNNMSEKHYSFEVYEGLTKVVEYYDLTGRLINDSEDAILSKGVYIKMIKYTSNDKEIYHDTKRIIKP